MAWKTLNENDLVSFLSQREVDAFRRSSQFETDVIQAILAAGANYARGAIRASGVKLAAEAGSIPESVVAPTLDYVAFDVLKRLSLPVNETRSKAREQAIAYFERVATGKMAVEGADETADAEESAKATAPDHATVTPPRLLD